MLTSLGSILKFLKLNMSKSKTYFEILGKKVFRWHLEIWENQIRSMYFWIENKKNVSNSKKEFAPCLNPHPLVIMPPAPPPPGNTSFISLNLTFFFDFQFRNTSNLIFSDFKVSSKSFFPKDSKIGLTFWHIWFQKFQNWVRSCQHIDGTPCIWRKLISSEQL